MVFYHGDQVDFRGLYFADVCECSSCAKEDVQSYVLRSQDGRPVLRNVRREAISVARIA